MQSFFRVHWSCWLLLLVLGSQMSAKTRVATAGMLQLSAIAPSLTPKSAVDKNKISVEVTDSESPNSGAKLENTEPKTADSIDVKELFWNGRDALDAGDASKAEAIFRQILELSPETDMAGQVYNALGESLQAQKKFKPAIKAFEQAITTDPNLFQARTNRSITQYQMGDIETARISLKTTRTFLPQKVQSLSDVSNYRDLANGFNTIGDFPSAVQVLRQAIQINPYIANAGTCYLTSDAMQSLGLPMSVTTRQYRSARCEMGFSFPPESDFQEQNKALRQKIYSAVAQNPTFDEVYRKSGLNQIPFIYPHTLFEPDSPQDRIDEAYAITHLNLGINLLNRAFLLGDMVAMEEAKTAFQTSLKHNPKYPWTYLKLGTTLIAQGQLEEAVSQAQKGLSHLGQQQGDTKELVQRPAWAYNLLGTALELQGDIAGATSMYQKAWQLDNTFGVAEANLERLKASQN